MKTIRLPLIGLDATSLGDSNFPLKKLVFIDASTGLHFRQEIRDGSFVIDKELTELGFQGEEGTDWENIWGVQ